MLSKEITYSKARAELASVLEEVEQNRSIVVINRRGHEGVALIAAQELSSMLESLHLMRSPNNAQWLLESMAEADNGDVIAIDDVDALARNLGLERTEDYIDAEIPQGFNLLDPETTQNGSQDP